MRKLLNYFAVVLSFSSLAACVNFGPTNNHAISNYDITVPQNNTKTKPVHKVEKTIQVSKGLAMPAYSSNKIIYTQAQSSQINAYAYHYWIAPPAAMISPLVAQALSDSDAFKAVISSATFNGGADYQVNVQIVKLQQVIDKDSHVDLVLNVMLYDDNSHSLVVAKQFKAEVMTAASPEGAVDGTNKAVGQLLPQITQFIITNTR